MRLYYIYKINSSKLMENDYNIKNYTIADARENKELISIGNNQVFEFIKNIRKFDTDFEYIQGLYKQRDKLKKKDGNYEEIIKLQKEIDDSLLFKDIINIHVDNKNAYKHIRARNNGFILNNVKYVRLCCGAGQARRNTVTFVAEDIYKELRERLMNGLDIKEINIAKFNAYFGLYMSATDKVETPRVCLIDDCELLLKNKKVDWVEDDVRVGLDGKTEEYRTIEEKTMDLVMNVCDGQGLISPSMSAKWSKNLGLDYVASQFIVRSSFLKGSLVNFDIHKFAKEVAHTDKIIDHYGKEWDINEIDVLVSVSQFKMYKYYKSWDEYVDNCSRYGHYWGVAKPNKGLDDEYSLINYQYLQNLIMGESDLKEISQYTIDWFKNICSGDELYSKLFLNGVFDEDITYSDIMNKSDNTFVKAVLYNPEFLKDSYIQSKIYNLIQKKIDDAKIGRLYVKGNYQVMVADPYLQCESAFGLEPKGLLKEFEHYSKFWIDKGVYKVDACRSPMVDFSEHNILTFIDNEDTREWYKHCPSGIIYNGWGLDTIIHSDSDFDGDIVFSTDNDVIIRCIKPNCNPITYAKTSAPSMKLKETNITKADLQSFNCTVGRTTNYSTIFDSMICNFEQDSEEYKELINRKKTLRRYIGDSIDAAKGIKTKKFPTSWKSYIKFDKEIDSEEVLNKKHFQNKLVAKKKPYFMIYIYESLKNEYSQYINSQRTFCFETFGMKLNELKVKENKTDEEKDFLRKYYKNMPVTTHNCSMNKLCWYLDSIDKDIKLNKPKKVTKEYIDSIINPKLEWDEERYEKTVELFNNFSKEKSLTIKNTKMSNKSKDNVVDDTTQDEVNEYDLDVFYEKYRDAWLKITTDESEFANYAFKVCYSKNKNKDFVWCLAFDGLMRNLKNNFKGKISVPIQCSKDVGIEYLGRYYKLKEITDDNIQREDSR